MIVTLQSKYLDRYLWNVQGNNDLSFPQTDEGVSPTPSIPVYIATIPELGDSLGRNLWIQTGDILAPIDQYEPESPEPSPLTYIDVPYLTISDLAGTHLEVSWDGYDIADRLFIPTITPEQPESNDVLTKRCFPSFLPIKTPVFYPQGGQHE